MTWPAHVQRLAALLLEAMDLSIENGQLTLNFGEGRVQTIEHRGVIRLPAEKAVDKTVTTGA
jgi:hypothetical protein